jgi:hypothetical protein
MTVTIRYLRVCTPLAALLLASCTGVGYRYDYTHARQVHPWGAVSVGLHTNSSYYRDGVSMMGGPWIFVVTVMITDEKAVPPTCRVRFHKAELLDTRGAVEARLGPADLTLQTSPTPKENSQGKQAMMYVSSQGGLMASLPHDIIEVPYQEHGVAVDVSLEGCGAADGDYQLRDVIKTDYQKRRFNPVFDAMMSV